MWHLFLSRCSRPFPTCFSNMPKLARALKEGRKEAGLRRSHQGRHISSWRSQLFPRCHVSKRACLNKAAGYSALHLGKDVESGMCRRRRHTEAKSFHILQSLQRAEKYSILRRDVLTPRAAATVPVAGRLVRVRWARHSCPSKSIGSHCGFGPGLIPRCPGFLTAHLPTRAPWRLQPSPRPGRPCKNFVWSVKIHFLSRQMLPIVQSAS